MKLVKPNWVTHDGFPIFSVDIHPDGKRFATGGQGVEDGCGRVVIWNTEPVLNEESEADSNIPKLLCQMDHHLACVNCVRWNSSGLLASGGDDKVIMIWKYSPGGQQNNLFGSGTSVETWRCCATLRGHNGDILDFAWSPFNQWLASASIDNTVIIWDVPKSLPIVCLKGHTGLVKGVTWDPIGKYLASQSDDKSLRIWRTSDWRQETVITEPFDECGGTTHVLRLSWSPDGQYLVSAHAMNGGGPTAQIIERDGWKTDIDFVGHRKAVTCVRFNGKIFQKENNESQKSVQFCCVAIGSRDRSLSVWSTGLKRPLVVIHEMFVSSLLDITWSPCGMRLCACSKDGTVVFIEFTEKELGQPLKKAQEINIQERLYGKLNKENFAIIEEPEILKVKKTSPDPEPKSKPAEMPFQSENKINNLSSAQPTVVTPRKQVETRTADGKRRITPMFISSQSESMDIEPSNSIVPTIVSSSSAFSSNNCIGIEKRDEVVEPNVSTIANNSCPKSKQSIFEKLKPIEGSTKSQIQAPSKKNQIPVERSGGTILLPRLKPNSNLCRQTGQFFVSCTTSDHLSHLQMFHGTKDSHAWEHYLGYCPTAIAITHSIVAVACEDGSIHTFHTIRGSRAVPPLIPPSPIAKLIATGNMIMVISCTGEVRVWEITKTSCRLHITTSAAHLINPGVTIMQCLLHNGQPHLIFTNARAYMFHKDMGTWLLIGDGNDPVWRWHAVNALDSTGVKGKKPDEIGPLARIQEGLNRVAGRVLPYFKIPNSGACIIAYLEQQVLASQALTSSREYKMWMLQLINFLSTHENNEDRLRVILDELLGPSHSSAHLSNWDSEVVGVKKHEILDEALRIIAGNVRYQRLYVEYNEQFEELKKAL